MFLLCFGPWDAGYLSIKISRLTDRYDPGQSIRDVSSALYLHSQTGTSHGSYKEASAVERHSISKPPIINSLMKYTKTHTTTCNGHTLVG